MKLLSVLRKDLRILLRNRADVLVLFLMPLAFIIPISLALGSGDGYGIQRDNQMISLPVANYDGGPRAQDLLAAIGESLLLEQGRDAATLRALGLEGNPDCTAPQQETPAATDDGTPSDAPSDGTTPDGDAATPTPAGPATAANPPACDERAARVLLQRSRRIAALVIPPGFSLAVDSGQPAVITLLYDPAGDPVRLQQVEGIVKGATVRLSARNGLTVAFRQLNDLAALAPEAVQVSVEQQAEKGRPSSRTQALRLEKTFPPGAEARPEPDTYQQTVPGYTVMFVFFIITSLAGSIRQEKALGTFRRLLSAPVSRAELLAGKLLSSILIGLVQVLVLFLVGVLAFRLSLGQDPLAFLLLTFALVTTAATLGLAAATTSAQGAGLIAPLVIAALLGGCMFPLDLMPPAMRSLSIFVPHRWALEGYQHLMVRGLGLQDVLPHIAILLVFSLVFFLIAMRRFKLEE